MHSTYAVHTTKRKTQCFSYKIIHFRATHLHSEAIYIFQPPKKLNTRQSDGEKNLKNHLKDYVRGGNSGGAFLKGLEGAFWRWGGFKGGRI